MSTSQTATTAEAQRIVGTTPEAVLTTSKEESDQLDQLEGQGKK